VRSIGTLDSFLDLIKQSSSSISHILLSGCILVRLRANLCIASRVWALRYYRLFKNVPILITLGMRLSPPRCLKDCGAVESFKSIVKEQLAILVGAFVHTSQKW
jgi:hypothetical protein